MASKTLNTLQDRLRYWREKIARCSLRGLLAALESHLAPVERIGVSTLSNYEHGTEPRASFLAGLKAAYPDLNLDWLLTGSGSPTLGQTGAAGATEREPGWHWWRTVFQKSVASALLRDLPPSALAAVSHFLSEVRPAYRNHPRAWPGFVRRFTELLLAPLRSKPHFLGRSVLSDTEVTTYVLTFIAAVRPLVMVWSPLGMAETFDGGR